MSARVGERESVCGCAANLPLVYIGAKKPPPLTLGDVETNRLEMNKTLVRAQNAQLAVCQPLDGES